MRRSLIQLINVGVLILVFIMVPAITGRNLGSLRLSDHSILFQLTVGGLCVGIALNALLAWAAVRTRKDRALCLGWAGLFGLCLFLVLGQAAGWLHFRWLKDWLVWAGGLAMGSGGRRHIIDN
jgi:hypothetical protein